MSRRWVGKKITPRTSAQTIASIGRVVRWTPGSGKIPTSITEVLRDAKKSIQQIGLGERDAYTMAPHTEMRLVWDRKWRRWRLRGWRPRDYEGEDDEIYFIAPINKAFMRTAQYDRWNAGFGEPGDSHNPWPK